MSRRSSTTPEEIANDRIQTRWLLGLAMSLIGTSISYGSAAWRHLPAKQIFLAILICLAVGIALTVVGAVYPAWRAARMQPIEAMRVET